MSNIKIEDMGKDMGKVLSEQLRLYGANVQKQVNELTAKAADDLVRITKDTAPYNAKAHHRHFVDCIAKKTEKNHISNVRQIWYVKAPCYRLTHLLVHGHAKKNGGRTSADPFLKNAYDKAIPEYEKAVEEVIRNG